MMSANSHEEEFRKWLALRNRFRESKRNRNYPEVVSTGKEIIALAEKADSIGIVIALFYRDIGNAYLKLEDKDLAVDNWAKAIDEFTRYRNTRRLSNPADWLRDIETLRRKIAKIVE